MLFYDLKSRNLVYQIERERIRVDKNLLHQIEFYNYIHENCRICYKKTCTKI